MLNIKATHRVQCDHNKCCSTFVYLGYTNDFVDSLYDEGWKLHFDGCHWFCPKHASKHKDKCRKDPYNGHQ